jgi:catechol 2,3-dioxygenase-like lactoylglutathione lyase family enzyme
MIDHLGLATRDLEAAKAFYAAALAPLGIQLMMEYPGAAGFGRDGKPFFWIGGGGHRPDYWAPAHEPGRTPIHIAFHAASREAVRAFHAAAIAAGGKDHGGPGLRPQYHPTYYGAFVIDPDGNNVEAVCHTPEP